MRVSYEALDSLATSLPNSVDRRQRELREDNRTVLYVFPTLGEFRAVATNLSKVDLAASVWLLLDTSGSNDDDDDDNDDNKDSLKGLEDAVSHLLTLESLLFVYRRSRREVTELYRIGGGHDSPAVSQPYGRFGADGRLRLPARSEYIWDRRSDLRGHAFRAAYVVFEPFVYEGEDGAMMGLMYDMASTLREALNFTLDLVRADYYGERMDDGTWTGIVGMLYRREVDLSINDISITESRSKVGT